MNSLKTSVELLNRIVGTALLCLAVFVAGCSGQEPDQSTCSGAYAIYRNAIERRDHTRLYRLLDRDIAAKADLLFSNVSTARGLVSDLPIPMQAQYTSTIGVPAVREATTSEDFLGVLIGVVDEGVRASFWKSMIFQYKSCREVPEGSGQFEAVPMDGIAIRFVRRGDGLLYHVPSGAERVNLQKALVKSERAIKQIRLAGDMLRQGGDR